MALSALTVLHKRPLLSESLSHTVKWRLIVRNVCDAMDAPRATRKQMVSLDSDEAASFLDAANKTSFNDPFSVAVYTGLHRSEVLALRWPEVDLARQVLCVVAGLHRLPGEGLVLLPTKTARSRRQAFVTQEVMDVLRPIHGYQMMRHAGLGPAWQDTGLVFSNPEGKPLGSDVITRAFVKVIERAA